VEQSGTLKAQAKVKSVSKVIRSNCGYEYSFDLYPLFRHHLLFRKNFRLDIRVPPSCCFFLLDNNALKREKTILSDRISQGHE
jgi:hypothetical protein